MAEQQSPPWWVTVMMAFATSVKEVAIVLIKSPISWLALLIVYLLVKGHVNPAQVIQIIKSLADAVPSVGG